MAMTTNIFDRTLAETNDWIEELNDELGRNDAHHALQAMRAVFHALRDELSVEQNAQLTAQLPTILRGIYYEAWRPKPFVEHSDVDTFLDHVAIACEGYARFIEPGEIATSVFAVLERRVSGECRKIRATLPKDLRELWPEP